MLGAMMLIIDSFNAIDVVTLNVNINLFLADHSVLKSILLSLALNVMPG